MQISLCAEKSTLDVKKNLEKISEVVSLYSADFYVFPEAFLQGFDFLTFNYKDDIDRVVQLGGKEIAFIKRLARENNKAIGFGYYENYKGAIYSSYMVVDKKGETILNYRRVSSGWRPFDTCADYREGSDFYSFNLDGKVFSCLICGDLWEDKLLLPILEMDEKVDAFLYPVHCDYTVDFWENCEHKEYQKRSAILAKTVLFCNNYTEGKKTAKGGAYVWSKGAELYSLGMGAPKSLVFQI